MAAVSSVYLISIHALREEGDRDYLTSNRILPLFLSTPSARRATQDNQQGVLSAVFLSTPSARRATLSIILPSYQFMISIHALREEGDLTYALIGNALILFLSTPSARRATPFSSFVHTYCFRFLSTPSARRATFHVFILLPSVLISIHALREEGDLASKASLLLLPYFYPRPPRGGRRYFSPMPFDMILFLSTPSARRATGNTRTYRMVTMHFYPRPPRGGRQYGRASRMNKRYISIHALREEGDTYFYSTSTRNVKFLSTPSARRATRLW